MTKPKTPFFEPPANAIDIGGGHVIVYAPWSRGFESNPSYQAWDVVQREPLTLSPSLLCRACQDYGHITNGKWVKA